MPAVRGKGSQLGAADSRCMGEGSFEGDSQDAPDGACLLVQVLCPGEVGHSRVDTASEILKNHGASGLSWSSVCIWVGSQLGSRRESCCLVCQAGNGKWWPKTRDAPGRFAVANVLEAPNGIAGCEWPPSRQLR